VSGGLSDRFGRKPMMLAPGILLLVTIFPAFYVISHFRTTATLLGATAALSILASLWTSPAITWLTESFPAPIRSGGVAIVYAVAIATFGGTTQFAVTWLIQVTGNPLAPAWYWTAGMMVGLAAMSATRETAPRKLEKPRPVELVRNEVLDVE
jgi:MFS transporter, MHS family, citrate/tricarballylate:H+ symporter